MQCVDPYGQGDMSPPVFMKWCHLGCRLEWAQETVQKWSWCSQKLNSLSDASVSHFLVWSWTQYHDSAAAKFCDCMPLTSNFLTQSTLWLLQPSLLDTQYLEILYMFELSWLLGFRYENDAFMLHCKTVFSLVAWCSLHDDLTSRLLIRSVFVVF